MPVDLRPFQQLTVAAHALELGDGLEMIIHPILLSRAAGPRRRGHGIVELVAQFAHPGERHILADTGRAGNNHQQRRRGPQDIRIHLRHRRLMRHNHGFGTLHGGNLGCRLAHPSRPARCVTRSHTPR